MPRPCPICDTTDVRHFHTVAERELLICAFCRHIFWADVASERDLVEFYSNRYGWSHHQQEIQSGNASYYDDHASELLHKSGRSHDEVSIVDIGCSYPYFLEAAMRRGYKCAIGVDWDRGAHAYGRERGIRMVTPNEFVRDTPPRSIDIIRFSHTIEHLIDPRKTLREAAEKLKCGGMLYITQPSFPVFAMTGRGHELMDAVWPEHLHFFSPISLHQLVTSAGFETFRFFTHGKADEQWDRFKPDLDLAYAQAKLGELAPLGEPLFGAAGNLPVFAGQNCSLYARRIALPPRQAAPTSKPKHEIPARRTRALTLFGRRRRRPSRPAPKPGRSIVGVSDVSVGYGSPQVLRFMESLADHYSQTVTVLEPDQSEKKPLDTTPPRCTIERIATTVHPHTELGRREYISATSRRLNALRPDMLVLFGTYSLPVLTQLRYRPNHVIYYCYEMVAMYGERDVAVNRRFARDLDVVLFPEENRARIDSRHSGLAGVPMAVIYNVHNEPVFEPSPVSERLAKFLYSGTIDRDHTLADYFFQPEVARFDDARIDLYGTVAGRDIQQVKTHLACLRGSVRYHGYVPAATLKQLRRQYAYSIIMWAPVTDNQLYAAPNKFFDAIADGLPPVAAPHPQCKLFIERYQCGVLMEDWSLGAFVSALKRARAIFGTSEYERMVAGCGRAVECELNWPAQFEKARRLLPAA